MRNTAKSQEAGEKNRSVRARYNSIAPLRKRSFFIALCAALLTLMIPVLIYVYIVFSKDGFAAVVLIPAAAAAALTAALIVLIARQEKINSLLEETVTVLEYNDRYLYRFNRRMAAHTRPAASAVFAGAAAFCGLAGGLAVSASGLCLGCRRLLYCPWGFCRAYSSCAARGARVFQLSPLPSFRR